MAKKVKDRLGMKAEPQRCLNMFLQAIGSPETVKKYQYELDRFMKWNEQFTNM